MSDAGTATLTTRLVDRQLVLLSAQRALLGEVFAALRAVTVEWDARSVKLRAYIDGPIRDEDSESISCVATEMAGNFPEGVDVDHEVIRRDAPPPVAGDGVFVFSRRE